MKQITYILISLLLVMACSTEQVDTNTEAQVETLSRNDKSNKINVCHYSADDDQWILIDVKESSWADHALHGDVRLDDQDGDGFVPYNECGNGAMGDCDDLNPAINPNAEEVCGDGIDNNCDGNVDENCFIFACGTDLDFTNLDLIGASYVSDCLSTGGSCGEVRYTDINIAYYDSEGNFSGFQMSAYDFRNYTCELEFDDYYVQVLSYSPTAVCEESYGCQICGDLNIGSGTVELYDEVVGIINNLAAELGLENSCAIGERSSGADSLINMESMPYELKKILEERKALLPINE